MKGGRYVAEDIWYLEEIYARAVRSEDNGCAIVNMLDSERDFCLASAC